MHAYKRLQEGGGAGAEGLDGEGRGIDDGKKGGGGGRTFDFNVMRPTYLIAFFSQSKKQTKMEWIRLHIRVRLYLWSSYSTSVDIGYLLVYL